jgi:hypothetical protein
MDAKRAIIVVSGGAAHCSYLPDGVEIEIRDYDMLDLDDPRIAYDNDGDPYIKMEFVH